MAEILATTQDINANLPSEDESGGGAVVKATVENTALLQISVARVIRGYLSAVLPRVTLVEWTEPELTPEIVREAAAMMIAAHLYSQKVARSTAIIEDTHYSQKLYDRAIGLLNKIVKGEVDLGDIVIDSDEITLLDFHPVDDTGRAFSIGMEF